MLHLSNIDISIIVVYLVLLLIAGIYHSGSNRTVADYALSNGQFSLPVVFMSTLAADMGGSTLAGNAERVYVVGAIHTVICIILAVTLFFSFIKVIIPYMDDRFVGMYSAADIIGKSCGKSAELITGVIGVISCMLRIGVQTTCLGYIFTFSWDLSYEYGVMIGGSVVVFYSAVGGMKSITITDVMQISIVFAILPLLASLSLFSDQEIPENIYQEQMLNILKVSCDSIPFYLAFFTNCCLGFVLLEPSRIQRCLMIGSRRKLLSAYLPMVVPWVLLHIFLFLVVIGLSMHAEIKNPKEVLLQAIDQLLPHCIKGLVVVGIMAVIMSTIDSVLNTTSVLFSRNVVKILLPTISEGCEVLLMKCSTVVIGLFSMVVALYNKELFDSIMLAGAIWMMFIAVPLMMCILRWRVSKKEFFAHILLAILIYSSIHTLFDLDKVIQVMITEMIGCFSFIPIHVIVNNGKIVFNQKDKSGNEVISEKSIWAYLDEVITRIDNTVIPSKNLHLFVALSVFLLHALPMFTYHDAGRNIETITSFRFCSCLVWLCIGTKSYWPSNYQHYLGLCWYFGLFLSVTLFTSYMYFYDIGELFFGIRWLVAMIFVALVNNFIAFMILSLFGVFTSLLLLLLEYVGHDGVLYLHDFIVPPHSMLLLLAFICIIILKMYQTRLTGIYRKIVYIERTVTGCEAIKSKMLSIQSALKNYEENGEYRKFDVIIGARIKDARKRQGITQLEIAEVLYVTPQQVSKLESGKDRISTVALFRISQRLGVQVSDFLEGCEHIALI